MNVLGLTGVQSKKLQGTFVLWHTVIWHGRLARRVVLHMLSTGMRCIYVSHACRHTPRSRRRQLLLAAVYACSHCHLTHLSNPYMKTIQDVPKPTKLHSQHAIALQLQLQCQCQIAAAHTQLHGLL
jgi:hypothetical protein